MKRIIVSVTNDLATDQRVRKTCNYLAKRGWEVCLVGRKLPGSMALQRDYETRRFKLLFNKGALFYANYNMGLFFFLLLHGFDALYANDLDTLPANYLAARLKSKPLVYDSHEYFTEVPEIQQKPFVKRTWLAFERAIFPKLRHAITVNRSIAEKYEEKYKVKVGVVRNVPEAAGQMELTATREDLNLPAEKPVLILQGAGINVDRGAEELVMAMEQMPDFLLLIIGGGDVFPVLDEIISDNHLQGRVRLMRKMPREKLMQYTACSDLGLSMDKDTNLNYRYSLPNKLFDYLQAGVPVLVSDLPEIRRIVDTYEVGWVAESHEPAVIANRIKTIFSNNGEYNRKKENTVKALQELTWEKETETLDKIFGEIERG